MTTVQRVGITITGYPGSGSTTLGKNLARHFDWPQPHYAGDVIRYIKLQMQKNPNFILGISEYKILEWLEKGIPSQAERCSIGGVRAQIPKWVDGMLDDAQRHLMIHRDIGIHEGHVAHFFAHMLQKEGFATDKIFVHICTRVEPLRGAMRQMKRIENQGKKVTEIERETEDRIMTDRARYQELYGLDDHYASRYFDIVLNTTEVTEEDAFHEALRRLEIKVPFLFKK